MNSEELKTYKDRLLASDLIFDVLTGKKTVQEALSQLPQNKTDINIKCAFDALMHREADEDLRAKIRGYAEVQDDFLADIAEILKQNRILPKNIIEQYNKFHKDNLIADTEDGIKNVLKKIKRMINF